jgi:malate dehydrogenase (oxaloacetate-decarboxylating)(NADP+)
MEGKSVLFKRFDRHRAEQRRPRSADRGHRHDGTRFGGINLEDIKAPECFVIEQTLRERMNIPVMHDDQHGTAIIAAAGLINACLLTNRNLKTSRLW